MHNLAKVALSRGRQVHFSGRECADGLWKKIVTPRNGAYRFAPRAGLPTFNFRKFCKRGRNEISVSARGGSRGVGAAGRIDLAR